jgi:hypothetical protein
MFPAERSMLLTALLLLLWTLIMLVPLLLTAVLRLPTRTWIALATALTLLNTMVNVCGLRHNLLHDNR